MASVLANVLANSLMHNILNKTIIGPNARLLNSYWITVATSKKSYSARGIRNVDDGKVIFEQQINVKPYGHLQLDSTLLPVQLDAARPMPGDVGNVITMKIVNFGNSHRLPTESPPSASSFGIKVNAESGLRTSIVQNDCLGTDVNAFGTSLLHLQVPHHYSVEVRTRHRHGVSLRDLESNKLRVMVDGGDCIAENVRCSSLAVSSVDGNVRCRGSVVGSIDMATTGVGAIWAGRLQGSVIKLHSAAGGIIVNDVHGETNHIFCDTGDVTITNLNGSSRLHVNTGNLKIGYLDGAATVTMDSGNADVQVSQMRGNVMVVVGSGNLDLKMLASVRARVTLQGKDIVLGEGMDGNRIGEADHETVIFEGSVNDGKTIDDPLLVAIVPSGKINIGTAQWITGLNLSQTTDNKIT